MCGVDLNLLMANLVPSSETIRLIAPILGPVASAVIVASAAIWVGKTITARLGHIQLLNQFNERFHRVVEKMHDVEQRSKKVDEKSETLSAEAHELYRQFFALMSDQLFAYQKNLLFESTLVDWMIWRVYAYKETQGSHPFAVAGVTYRDGWEIWSKRPALAGQVIVRFLTAIHACDPKGTNDPNIIRKDVRKVVRAFKRKR
jgi:hypothetical protein